ncbi:Lysophospholipase L2 [Vibrio stylophorae]|uniref:Lysophospholipase L2 n=1 Tax=Vibrio stylophorae TaxID=659351 RepID=A0ABM8ZXI9_9VIBR|nr:alpha/beta fold hydrolase [Vibrio stylophorae]CAH0534718.1 Lysophospholipase L2 [Vibrio stylophorae]
MPSFASAVAATDQTYANFLQSQVSPWWQQVAQSTFSGRKDKKIAYCHAKGGHRRVIIVVSGRIESMLKYQPLLFELFQQGFDIVALDHRGQGLSERLTHDPIIGHIDQFNYFIDDLNSLYEQVIAPMGYAQHYMLAHSMGGTIASRFVQRYPHKVDRLALCAPMLGVQLPPALKIFAPVVARCLDLFQRQPHYAFGQGPYCNKPFAENKLTHDEIRYHAFRNQYELHPQIKLGGPSNRWVWQSLRACHQCFCGARKHRTPTLLLQAELEQIVDNHSQARFNQLINRRGGNCKLHVVTGAKHEILFEQDEIRNQAIDLILQHFKAPN